MTTTRRFATLAALLALALLITGCSDSSSDVLGGAGLTDDTGDASLEFSKGIADAAVATDSMTQQAMSVETSSIEGDPMLDPIGRPTPSSVDRSISRTMPCPAGGSMTVEGTLEGTFDRDTRTLEINGTGTRASDGCTFARNEMTITIEGSSSWEWTRRLVNGMTDGLQTRRYYGSWTATNDEGLTRSCTFDYTVAYDPETRTTSVDGELCDSPLQPRESWKAAS